MLQDETYEILKESYRGQQYSQIYFMRLDMMRTILHSLVHTWKPHVPGKSLKDLSFSVVLSYLNSRSGLES